MPRREALLQIDSLRVAGTISMADRAFRRHPRLGDWVRTFNVECKLAEPYPWTMAADALARLAAFLTDDNWVFEFTALSGKSSTRGVRRHEPAVDAGARYGPVALFSGGLDSFCGACKLMAQRDEKATPIFVSSYVNELKRLADLLQGIAGANRGRAFLHLPVHGKMAAAHASGLDTDELPERSRRGRSLYYVFQAFAAAIEFNAGEIHLYENGIMALNLPLRASDSGCRASRHAHPYYLSLANAFVHKLMGRSEIRILNPFSSTTKAEILQHARGAESLIDQTTTCWGYPNATRAFPGITHCGHCLPCLVRRFALASAKVKDSSAIYHKAGLASAWRQGFPRAKPDIWAEARRLVGFAARIHSLKSVDLVWKFGGHFAHLAPNVSKKDVDAVRNLYGRFASEIDRVIASAR
jgi:7-cyano-7-deazaguanine synthase in queuosine biosynthesis